MVKHLNIKTGGPQICGRTPLFTNNKYTEAAKTARYYKYQMLFYHYHPTSNKKGLKYQRPVRQLAVVIQTSIKAPKTKWYEIAPHWIVELFTREKANQEILSRTA